MLSNHQIRRKETQRRVGFLGKDRLLSRSTDALTMAIWCFFAVGHIHSSCLLPLLPSTLFPVKLLVLFPVNDFSHPGLS